MSLANLKAELQKKRKQLADADVIDSNNKFFRRGDLTAKEEENYWQKYYEKRRSISDTDEAGKVLKDSSEKLFDGSHPEYFVARDEVIKRLRDRNEPIRVFGELDDDALRRLRKLEIEAPEINKGWRNDLQDAISKDDAEFLDEILMRSGDTEGRHDVAIEDDGVTIESIMDDSVSLGKGNSNDDCEICLSFFNFLLRKWGHELNERDEEEKRSGRGKMSKARYTQTREYLAPLFRKLGNKSCPADILEHLVSITHYMLHRDYVQANNAYMEMAIGNAPWPVGVTASGIHKRPGNEKFWVKNVAHVLNDETQRKYIQALKRLMTKCQQYCPTDPSKSVDFVPL